jgi:hypothetical protein
MLISAENWDKMPGVGRIGRLIREGTEPRNLD